MAEHEDTITSRFIEIEPTKEAYVFVSALYARSILDNTKVRKREHSTELLRSLLDMAIYLGRPAETREEIDHIIALMLDEIEDGE